MPCNHHSLGLDILSQFILAWPSRFSKKKYWQEKEKDCYYLFLLHIQWRSLSDPLTPAVHVSANPTGLNIPSFQPHFHYAELKTGAPMQENHPSSCLCTDFLGKGFHHSPPESMIVPHDLDIFMSGVLQSPSSVRGPLCRFQCHKPDVSILLSTEEMHTRSLNVLQVIRSAQGKDHGWVGWLCQLHSNRHVPQGQPGKGEISSSPHTKDNRIKNIK